LLLDLETGLLLSLVAGLLLSLVARLLLKLFTGLDLLGGIYRVRRAGRFRQGYRGCDCHYDTCDASGYR
jgi:hypothetical protein